MVGNEKQQAALNVLIGRLVSERGLAQEGGYTAELDGNTGKVNVLVDLPNFPLITIGKGGGVDMPEVKSYPQEKGGATAMDACIKGDEHLKRQSEGRRPRVAVPAVQAGQVEQPAPEQPAQEEAPAVVEPPPAEADPNVATATVTLE